MLSSVLLLEVLDELFPFSEQTNVSGLAQPYNFYQVLRANQSIFVYSKNKITIKTPPCPLQTTLQCQITAIATANYSTNSPPTTLHHGPLAHTAQPVPNIDQHR